MSITATAVVKKETKVDPKKPNDKAYYASLSVINEDGKEYGLVSRDLSPTGMRLLGTKQLLGQKIRVDLPQGKEAAPCRLLMRILWTCAVGDNLFENGGTFLELVTEQA